MSLVLKIINVKMHTWMMGIMCRMDETAQIARFMAMLGEVSWPVENAIKRPNSTETNVILAA